MTVWRVLINPKLWNLAKFRDEWTPSSRIAQAKGKCKMARTPKKGDLVKFVVKGFVIMTGLIETDGFRFGDEVALDEYNIGSAPHRESNAYTWIKAIRFCEPEAIEWHGQSTWCRLKRRLVRAPLKKEEAVGRTPADEEVCEDPR